MSSAKANRKQKERILKAVTCPHCWHHFDVSEIVWVAKHDDLRGDLILGGDAHIRFLPTRFNVDGDALDSRSMACQDLACPRCHLTIPRIFLKFEPLIFSLIGVPYSGKSYFLAAMTWELARILPTQYLMVLQNVDYSGNQTLVDFQEKLFFQGDSDQPVAIPKTQLDSATHYDSTNLDGQNVLLPRPFLFGITPMENHPNFSQADAISRVLCVYDNAGEHFLTGHDTSLTPGTQHVAKAKVLMFLYDPIQDPRIRQKCQTVSNDPQLSTYGRTQLQSPILTEAVSRVRQYSHLPSNKKLDQPLIVLIPKADIWESLINEDLTTEPCHVPKPPSREFAVVDTARIERVSAKIRRLLLEITPEFVATAEDCCREVVYIPVSSLGCSPTPQEATNSLVVKPRDIKPRWVTVPVLYAFSKWATGLLASQ